MRGDHRYPEKNLVLPILHYCVGVIIDQVRVIKTKTLCNGETKTFNFNFVTLRI